MAAAQEIAIIGGGIAGLAATHELVRAGRPVCLLEARQRLGGRIWTEHPPGWPVPLERGAEFIHGRPQTLWRLIEACHAAVYDVTDDHSTRRGGTLGVREDFWETLESVLGQLRALEGRADCSFADFLHRRCSDLPAEARELATMYVEGFDAAPADRASAQALRAAQSAGEKIDLDTPFRLVGGYDVLVRHLAEAVKQSGRARIRLGTVVREIHWFAGGVRVALAGGDGPIECRAAIVTLPVGVLHAAAEQVGAVRFVPELPAEKRSAIALLRPGPVVKVILRFRRAFWESHGQDDLAFLHRPGAAFPTWWTTLPMRTPILTAWAGGPAAEALEGMHEAAVRDRALDDLAAALAADRGQIAAELAEAHVCDWQKDPFARGAYSYAAVGPAAGGLEAVDAAKALAAPLGSALFFAGEATSADVSGTVAGALDSGLRAAGEVLSACGGSGGG